MTRVAHDLRCEFLADLPVIDASRPRFDWIAGDAESAVVDLVRTDQAGTGWRSADVGRRGWVEYDGPELEPLTTYEWTVHTERGTSAPARFSTGVRGAWPAPWWGADLSLERERPAPDPTDVRTERTWLLQPTLTFRLRFEASPAVSAVFVTALGLFEVWLNGRRLGNEELAPGWTDYGRRLDYRRHDVESVLRAGTNDLRVVVADGWYAGYVGYAPKHRGALWGSAPAVSAFLAEGPTGALRPRDPFGDEWEYRSGPARYADLQMGSSWDGSVDVASGGGVWRRPGRRAPLDGVELAAVARPPVRVTETRAGAVVARSRDRLVVDFGQNFAGRTRLGLRATGRAAIRIRHGEALEPDGSLYVANLRSAEQTDHYVTAGVGEEQFAPGFTIHGFRFAEITGDGVGEAVHKVTGEVMHTDTEFTGRFESDHDGLTRIWRSALWSQRSNFVSVPTDCPQRDERLGWLADAQVFLPTACFNADVAAFVRTWLDEILLAQSPSGRFPDVAPRANHPFDGAPGWDDGAALMTARLLQHYDDVPIARRMLPALVRWVDAVLEDNPGLVRSRRLGNNYGDWLSTGPETPPELVASAHLVGSLDAIIEIARALGAESISDRMAALAARARAAFAERFLHVDGRLAGDTQGAYALAIGFQLAPDRTARWVELLADALDRSGEHLQTGFLSTRFLLPALADHGRADLAYRVLLQETAPSWLACIRAGATTMWERWDAVTPSGEFAPPILNSMNHFAFGSVAEFLYTHVAGIRQQDGDRGFHRVELAPLPSRVVGAARASYRSPRGLLECGWRVDGELVIVEGRVPDGCDAVFVVPEGWAPAEGGRRLPLDAGSFRLVLSRAPMRDRSELEV